MRASFRRAGECNEANDDASSDRNNNQDLCSARVALRAESNRTLGRCPVEETKILRSKGDVSKGLDLVNLIERTRENLLWTGLSSIL
jgi:hypothetical protein